MVDARHLVEYASDAAFAIDSEQRIVAWNGGAQRLLKYTQSDVQGRYCWQVFQATYPNGEALCVPGCEGSQCFKHSRAFTARSCQLIDKDGVKIPASFESVAIPKRARSSDAGSTVAIIFLRSEIEKHYGPPSEQKLQVFVLGRFGLVVNGRDIAIEKWERKQAVTLMKILVAHLGRSVHRETLTEFFWPDIDEDRAWKRLKVTAHFLRQQLRVAGIDENIIETVNKTYALKCDAVWVDSRAFKRCIAKGAALQRQKRWRESIHSYEEAQHLYRGDYMDEDIYADWCAAEREQLHEIYLEMLAGIADCHATLGHYAEAVQICRTALVRDPCRESFHRTLMEYLVQLGRADWALDQYHRCRRILADELGVEPMRDTQKLNQQILEKYGAPRSIHESLVATNDDPRFT